MKIKIFLGLIIIGAVILGVRYFSYDSGNKNLALDGVEYKVFTGPTASHSFEIREGELWGWGNNEYGQLGDGSRVNRLRPIKIGKSKKWLCVATGNNHTIGLKIDGTLWAWGKLSFNEDEDEKIEMVPIQIGDENDWKTISAGRRHNLALKTDGSLWAWGSNKYGEIGNGNSEDVKEPIKIGKDIWITIATGVDYSIAIKRDSTLWSWGNNLFGQLGTGDTLERKIPTQVGMEKGWQSISISNFMRFGWFGFEGSSFGLKIDGSLWVWGSNDRGQLGSSVRKQSKPIKIESKLKWQMFDGGFGIKEDGSLWSWGPNPLYPISKNKTNTVPIQIGNDTNWKSIFNGFNHTFGIKRDGSIWGWGENNDGQIGIGCLLKKESPTSISRTAEWLHISGFHDHSLGIKADGSLWAWGSNSSGQLGIVNTTPQTSPIKVGSEINWVITSAGAERSLAIKSDGSLWEWGSIGDYKYRVEPAQVGCDVNWKNIEAGIDYNIGHRKDGSLWAWGDKSSTGISDEYSNNLKMPGLIFSDNSFSSFALGESSWFAIKSDNTLNVYGQDAPIEDEESSNKIGPSFVSLKDIVLSDRYNLALNWNGTLWSWSYKQDENEVWSKFKILGQIGSDSNWCNISASHSHILGLKSDGTLFAWGSNSFGQLGTGDLIEKMNPIQIGRSNEWAEIKACENYSFAIKTDGTLWSWGANSFGQLGHGDTLKRVRPTKVTSRNKVIEDTN